MTKEVKANVFAAEDLTEIVTQGHVLAAAMTFKEVTKLENLSLSENEMITSLSQNIVDAYLIPTFFEEGSLPNNRVTLYAREVMLMGLILHSLRDAIHEGDGPAVMSYWKVMTMMFRLTNRRK